MSLNQHAKTKSQTIITGGKTLSSLACISYNDSIIQSEMICILYIVSQELSNSSCDIMKTLTNAMFPGIILEIFLMIRLFRIIYEMSNILLQ